MANFWATQNFATQTVHAAHTPGLDDINKFEEKFYHVTIFVFFLEDYNHLPAVVPIMTCATYHRENRDIVSDDGVSKILLVFSSSIIFSGF